MNSTRALALCAGLPGAIVAVFSLWAVLSNSAGGWLWPPDSVNLPEAVATGNHAETVRLIERGADPNRAEEVRPRLLGSKATRVTPLQAAVWSRSAPMLERLLDRGAVFTPSILAVLHCMNDENRNEDVRAVLDRLGGNATTPCDTVVLPR